MVDEHSYSFIQIQKATVMALSMLTALLAAPALLGTQEAIRQGQAKDKREEHRGRRCNLVVNCLRPSSRSRELNDRLVVLRDGKVDKVLPPIEH